MSYILLSANSDSRNILGHRFSFESRFHFVIRFWNLAQVLCLRGHLCCKFLNIFFYEFYDSRVILAILFSLLRPELVACQL